VTTSLDAPEVPDPERQRSRFSTWWRGKSVGKQAAIIVAAAVVFFSFVGIIGAAASASSTSTALTKTTLNDWECKIDPGSTALTDAALRSIHVKVNQCSEDQMRTTWLGIPQDRWDMSLKDAAGYYTDPGNYCANWTPTSSSS
jgi:hypothetical protein